MSFPPSFHEPSGAVRFYTEINGLWVGSSISKETLHYRFRPDASGEDPMATYLANAAYLETVVRRRVASGSIEPVMLREHDLRPGA
ncbi:MAG: hypothetical protein IPP44_12570 [Ideonella sp.]|nr:hypothetical protein [Ideonella sp.]